MNKKFLLIAALFIFGRKCYSQSQIITTGNNLIDTTNPLAADIVIGSNANGGIRHDGSIMWWSNGSASRISNTADVFYLSVWQSNNPNIALNAIPGQPSYFQGYLGIGTTSPQGGLEINNVGNFWSSYNFGTNLLIRGTTHHNTIGIFDATNANPWAITNSSGALLFSQMPALGDVTTNPLTRIVFAASGNILIGKTSQTNTAYFLDVAGPIRANAITVNTTGADFVFEPAFKLLPLPMLKDYIDKNHHLPEIASAKEMEANGLNVGDNQVKLLQKVEELTLYLIEKDQQLNKEKEINGKQQRQLDTQSEQLKSQQEQLDQLKTQLAAILKKQHKQN